MKHEKIRVIQFGVGPIGLRTVEYLSEKHALEIVGAIDADPRKIGADLGELAGFTEPLGVAVRGDAAEALKELEAEVVILTTASSLEKIHPQVLQIVSSGKNVVSSCEELTYPWFSQPEIAVRLRPVGRRTRNGRPPLERSRQLRFLDLVLPVRLHVSHP